MLMFLAIFAISACIGAILGLLCRAHHIAAIILSIFASIAFFALAERRIGDPGEWSWQHPIASAAYLFAPFAALFVAPAVASAIFVARLCARHVVKNI
jgi:hypothetical protein